MKHVLVIGLIALALAGRVAPHPDNFTPVLAVALFGGAMLSGGVAYLVPLAAMFASDLLLGNSFTGMTVVVYGCFLVAAALGNGSVGTGPGRKPASRRWAARWFFTSSPILRCGSHPAMCISTRPSIRARWTA